MAFVFPPPAQPAVEIKGRSERFPVHRIYCVGRNYAAHAREMGKDPDRGDRLGGGIDGLDTLTLTIGPREMT